jgi:hypothetical protein
VRFRRRKDIPKPLDPGIPSTQPNNGIAIPYTIADAPRQFLAWLANYSDLPVKTREVIAEWLLGYNTELVCWLLMNYGYGGVLEADTISREVFAQFVGAVDEEAKQQESSLFDFLEKDLGDE